MWGIEAIVATAVLWQGGSAPAPAVTPADFREWFEAASRGRLRIPGPVEERARGFRYVLVGGMRNERMPGYFAQNVAELEAHGVPPEAIHEIHPSSDATFEENLDAIRAGFGEIAEAGPERLVVIAHSRGACDALAFALRDPGFVRDRVEALFLVQGPFGGSGLADYVVGEGTPMDRRMPPMARAVGGVVAGHERALMRRGRHGGLADLTSGSAREFWGKMLEEHADAIPAVGPRTYFVGAAVEASRQRFLRKPAARYLGTYYGPNDGVVAVEDQSLPGLGTNLGALDVGHTDLTHRFPAARARPRLRRALIQAVIMAVGRPRPESPAAAEDVAPARSREDDSRGSDGRDAGRRRPRAERRRA